MAIVIKNNYLIPVVRIGEVETPGTAMVIPTIEVVPSIKAGIDTTQYKGSVSFDTAQQVVHVSNGSFFIVDLQSAIALLGDYLQIEIAGGVNGNRGYLNGREIWKGKGTSYNVYKLNDLLREGWNDVQMNVGYIKIKGPFLTEI